MGRRRTLSLGPAEMAECRHDELDQAGPALCIKPGLCYKIAMAKPTVMAIAHRGASAVAPENTVAAFDEAIRLGSSAVEFDVRMSADGVPVVIHDDRIDRTTNGHGRVTDFTALELRRFDAGSWKDHRFAAARIPTLEEALLAIVDPTIPVLEIKAPIPAAALAELLHRRNAEARVIVISYHAELLAPLKALLPKLKLGLLVDEWNQDTLRRARMLAATTVVGNVRCVTMEHVAAAHAAGLKVWCFTANDVGLVAAMTALGVEGIITDYPDLIRSQRGWSARTI